MISCIYKCLKRLLYNLSLPWSVVGIWGHQSRLFRHLTAPEIVRKRSLPCKAFRKPYGHACSLATGPVRMLSSSTCGAWLLTYNFQPSSEEAFWTSVAMSGSIESPASLARRRLHNTEDDTDGDRQLEAVNGTTSKTEQQQPDEGSIIEC